MSAFILPTVESVEQKDHLGEVYTITNVPINLDHVYHFSKATHSDWDVGHFIHFQFAAKSVYWSYPTEEERNSDYHRLVGAVCFTV